ncbi:MAG: methionine synthase [Bacteroidales bacterium]|nr:methionine synthase [Bacteroidales bacterium]MCD8394772.1 methionine synthase [Bacteroidales bacterium]
MHSVEEALSERILVLDGAMGTMIQAKGLVEEDFRGEHWANHPVELKGCNDLLCVTRPDVIADIHRAYIEAGADIITANSFNANAISLEEYGLADQVTLIARTAAEVARREADEAMLREPGHKIWVAGSVGPTSKSLSMAQSLDEDGVPTTFDLLHNTYKEQIAALVVGGVDIILVETIFDSLNAKAAILAAKEVAPLVPIILSVTLTESGRTLAGQTLEAFATAIAHAEPLALSLNCGFGVEGMVPHVEEAQPWPFRLAIYPNAGLPNRFGQYDETPEMMVAQIEPLLAAGQLNLVGGCCGTTPHHIRLIAKAAAKYKPRQVPERRSALYLAGLEAKTVDSDSLFVNVGERCNVAGSRKFLRLIKEGSTGEALEIARKQVEAGAQVVDVNMDDAMLDSSEQMCAFLSAIGIDPDVARVPVMIDSSHWPTIVEGLKRVQGRPIVNSISLKEGPEKMLEKARVIKNMGAATVVMAFDEQGQADTYERKIEVCERAYRLLVDDGFPADDIIFDPNVLAVATGIPEHNNYARDFLRAVEWIKKNLPGARVSGGLSNLSFSLRGNNYAREAMHSVFLSHAIPLGMDMAIVNAGALIPVNDIPADLREAIDDVLLNRRDDATDRLITLATEIKERMDAEKGKGTKAVEPEVVSADPCACVAMMLRRGQAEGIEEPLQLALNELGSAMKVIDGPLMDGMNEVGRLFGEGKMFLPQVVKSAHAMKRAVAFLTPYIEQEKAQSGSSSAVGKVVIATVKGDVHDIGKNIVNVIMNCNGFEMVDMGVMVPGESIVDKAQREGADFVGLSGLITPSLEEMCNVARLMERQGMRIPLLIGGATTSALHTAVKIAPCYGGPVIYTRDAAMLPVIAKKIANPDTREAVLAENAAKQESLRRTHEVEQTLLPLAEARRRAPRFEHHPEQYKPKNMGQFDIEIPLAEARALINWRPFFATWKLDASMAQVAQIQGCDHCRAQWLAGTPQKDPAQAAEAMQLWKEANRLIDELGRMGDTLRGRVIITRAGSEGDDIVYEYGGERYRIPTLRQQDPADGAPRIALSDFLAPVKAAEGSRHSQAPDAEGSRHSQAPDAEGSRHSQTELPDYMALFAVTTGVDLAKAINNLRERGDDYKALLYQSVADRLAEASTEWLHYHVRHRLWGYADENEPINCDNLLRQYYQGIRPAIGYPSLPDQSLIFITDKALKYNELGIQVTENGAMWPTASTTGLFIAHPDSRYHYLGAIGADQRRDYAHRRSLPLDTLSRFLP